MRSTQEGTTDHDLLLHEEESTVSSLPPKQSRVGLSLKFLLPVLLISVGIVWFTKGTSAATGNGSEDLTLLEKEQPKIAIIDAWFKTPAHRSDTKSVVEGYVSEAFKSQDAPIVTYAVPSRDPNNLDEFYSTLAQADAAVIVFPVSDRRPAVEAGAFEGLRERMESVRYAGIKQVYVYMEQVPETDEDLNYVKMSDRDLEQHYANAVKGGGESGDRDVEQKTKQTLGLRFKGLFFSGYGLVLKMRDDGVVHSPRAVGATGNTVECTWQPFAKIATQTWIPNYRYVMYVDGVKTGGFLDLPGPFTMQLTQNQMFAKKITVRFERPIHTPSEKRRSRTIRSSSVMVYGMQPESYWRSMPELAAVLSCTKDGLKDSIPVPEAPLMVVPGPECSFVSFHGRTMSKDKQFYVKVPHGSRATWEDTLALVKSTFHTDSPTDDGMNMYMFDGRVWRQVDADNFEEKKSTSYPFVLLNPYKPDELHPFPPWDIKIPK